MILVGSTLPGLLDALKRAFGDTQEFLVIGEAEDMLQRIRTPGVTALILSDTVQPRPHQDVAQSLWEIIASLSHSPPPLVPVWLTLDRATPAVIRDALRAEVRKTGGDLYLLSSRIRTLTHPEIQQALAWMVGHLQPGSAHRQRVIVPLSAAGGSRKSTSMLNLCLALQRRGLRVLIVDVDIAQGALLTSLRVDPAPASSSIGFYTTLPNDHPDLTVSYPPALVQQRIYHHVSGLDALFAGHGIRDQLDMTAHQLDGLIDTIAHFDYDVVCYDVPGDWKQRNVIISLCTRRNTSPIVICPPGRKERTGALAALEVLGKVEREDGCSALDGAMIWFAAGERGLAVTVREVRREVVQRYPMLTDLGTLPHVPELLSIVTEQEEFCSVFDIAPRHAYCVAVQEAAQRWIEAVGPSLDGGLAMPNLVTRSRRQRFRWPFQRRGGAPH
jgi:MinD-like ATPase involved in chromosome partitioning or flagellar assembly